MTRWYRPVVAACSVLLVAACGPAEDEATQQTPPQSETSPDELNGAAATTMAAVSTGLDGITLLTPETGGGARPVLQWESVAGAASYRVVITAPDGRGYWSWQGDATSVPVGGHPALPDGAPGPRVSSGMSWSVAAFDQQARPVALSTMRPISP